MVRPLKVDVSPSRAVHWAKEVYGLHGEISPLPGDVDRNFLLDCGEQGRWVLKIANIGEDSEEIACQVEVLRFLRDSTVGGMVPRVRPTRGGDLVAEIDVGPDERSCVRVVSYLEGRPIACIGDPGPEMRTELGGLLATLDQHLLEFDHPGAHRHHMWDLVAFPLIRRYRQHADDEIGPIFDEVMNRFERRVAPELEQLRRSIVHNDANDYNILVSEHDGRSSISGLIDFGDLVFTITVADLAIATAYLMMAAADPISAAEDLRVGYEEVLPLTDLERELLPDLALARLCTTAVMAAQGRTVSPDDEYLTISEEPARRVLRRLV